MEPRWNDKLISDKDDNVADSSRYYMMKHPSLSNPTSRASSALASRSLESSFSRDSTGNQSAMKFISAQSTLAGEG